MEECLCIFDSGNYAYSMLRIFQTKSKVFEVISTPCIIAKQGCGYCLKAPMKSIEEIIERGRANNTPVREIYKIVASEFSKKYIKVYP